MGWKDTVITYPGEVTRIAVGGHRLICRQLDLHSRGCRSKLLCWLRSDPALQGGVGYVWHCHIVDHEDNEMMRNYVVGTASSLSNTLIHPYGLSPFAVSS